MLSSRHAYTCFFRSSCSDAARGQLRSPTSSNPAPDVRTFLTDANSTMLRLGIEQSRAGWVQQTFITDDTEALSALANRRFIDAVARLAKGATAFDNVSVSGDERRSSTFSNIRS